jgi:DNA gyrase subunit A
LIKKIPGPDFPTSGFICGREVIKSAYETGRGSIVVRARAFVEKQKKGEREAIIISELPYQVNKANLIEKIAELVRDKKVEGISDLRDESDRDGMRIVIELKRDGIAEIILNQLYQHTQMQTSFGVIMLAIVGIQPRVLNLKELLQHFINFRKEIITRRTVFELKKAEARAHILEGLKIAIKNLDAVIALIRSSANPQIAKEGLMKKFSLSEIQAQAILDMRLQRLTALERGKIDEEYKETIKQIERYKQILANERLVFEIIIEELQEIKKKYGDDRKTEIVDKPLEITLEDMIVEEDMVVTITHQGYIKRSASSLYRSQRRGGKGVTGAITKEEDFVQDLFVASTHSYLMFFTNRGKVYWLKVYEIPEAGRAARGKAIVNLIKLEPDEKITAILTVREFTEGRFVVMATRKGTVKKTSLIAYSKPRSTGIIALVLEEGDELIAVALTDGNQDLFLGSKEGKSIRFKEKQIRETGRATKGVRGMDLEGDDEIVGMEIVADGTVILTVCEHGHGKRTDASEYRSQRRGGKGIITIKTTERNGKVVGINKMMDDEDLMLITTLGKIIRIHGGNIPVIGRNTQGVRLIGIESEEKVCGVARLAEKEEEQVT